jgi:hypothetical protein
MQTGESKTRNDLSKIRWGSTILAVTTTLGIGLLNNYLNFQLDPNVMLSINIVAGVIAISGFVLWLITGEQVKRAKAELESQFPPKLPNSSKDQK